MFLMKNQACIGNYNYLYAKKITLVHKKKNVWVSGSHQYISTNEYILINLYLDYT